MLGSFWVGYAADHYGDCAIWMVAGAGFVMMWVILLPIYSGKPATATQPATQPPSHSQPPS